ncbi:MAG: hypothetical protein ACREXI_11810 [Caldimonas sp.]
MDLVVNASEGSKSRLACRSALAFALAWLLAGPAMAWSNHALCTWPALSVLPEVAQAAPVQAESLESFLSAEAAALVPVLAQEEQWARTHVPTYPPRPEALAYRADGATPAELRRRFLAALRINPESRLTLHLQVLPGQSAGGRPSVPESTVTTLERNAETRSNTYVGLRAGEAVAVLDVVTTASDEPDHGLDIGLWQDSGTPYGRLYGFGKQPFGANPAIEFASQAPFHIGYFHEAAIVYKAAPFLLRTYPEYRIHLYETLARHAFASGHPYWGWRFAGWALHYIQDLTQPYHARVLPGVSVPAMLWINTLDLAGVHGPKERAITYVTNRHLAIENYQLERLRGDWLHHDFGDAPMLALKDTARDGAVHYADAAPRTTITQESAAYADALDKTIERYLPAKYTSDPDYVFGVTEADVDIHAVVAKSGAAAQAAMTQALVRLLGNFGRHTRSFVRALREPARVDPVRR